ncbi:MAG: ferrous iron transport protein A [Proteobacteria bacterium]|jgi:Fe2+ transport system protein FeoA|nr:ferrous iron transport protein A [Pseudomonadota bacterium]
MIAHTERIRLTGTPTGHRVRLAEFGEEIDPLQREQLLAYGLNAQQPLTVLQQRPMTVILCEQMELALEHSVAHHIWVEEEAQTPS